MFSEGHNAVLSGMDFVISGGSIHTDLALPFLPSASFPRVPFSAVKLLLAATLPSSPRLLSGRTAGSLVPPDRGVDTASGLGQCMSV